MSTQKYKKYLINTTFVVSAAFYTNLFDVAWWDAQEDGLTWERVVEARLANVANAAELAGVLHTARAVDRLESMVARTAATQRAMGVGEVKPPTMAVVQSKTVRQFFQTMLLDRLVWSCEYRVDSAPPRLTLHRHPDVDFSAQTGPDIVIMPPARLDALIEKATKANRRGQAALPQWKDMPDVAHVDEVIEGEGDGEEEEARPEKKGGYVGVTQAWTGGTRAEASAIQARIMQNACGLAVSALFLIEGSAREDFYEKLGTRLRNVASSEEQEESLRELWKLVSEAPVGERLALATRAILLALAATPLIVLDTQLDIMRFRGIKTNGARWGKFLSGACGRPKARNTEHLRVEAAVWRVVGPWIGGAAEGPTVSQEGNALGVMVRTVGESLGQDVAEPLPLEVETVDWEYVDRLVYKQKEVEDAKAECEERARKEREEKFVAELSKMSEDFLLQRQERELLALKSMAAEVVGRRLNARRVELITKFGPDKERAENALQLVEEEYIAETGFGEVEGAAQTPRELPTEPRLQSSEGLGRMRADWRDIADEVNVTCNEENARHQALLEQLHEREERVFVAKESAAWVVLAKEAVAAKEGPIWEDVQSFEKEIAARLRKLPEVAPENEQNEELAANGGVDGVGGAGPNDGAEMSQAEVDEEEVEEAAGPVLKRSKEGELEEGETPRLRVLKEKKETEEVREPSFVPKKSSKKKGKTREDQEADDPERGRWEDPRTSYWVCKDPAKSWWELQKSELPVFQVAAEAPEMCREETHSWTCYLTDGTRLVPHERDYKLRWPKGTEGDMKRFEQVMANAVPLTVFEPTPGVDFPSKEALGADVLPQAVVELLEAPHTPLEWVEDMQRRMASKTLHIVCGARKTVPSHWDGDRTLSASDLKRRLGVNINLRREGHQLRLRDENNVEAQMRQSTVEAVLSAREPAFNFLDMMCAASVSTPKFLLPITVDSIAGQLPFERGFPQYSIKWHLLGTLCAMSWAHIDAAKFASWLHSLRGAKMWCVMEGEMPEAPLSELNYAEHKWKCFLLEEGDYLIMPPGTVHTVVTVADSFLEGGHFYSALSMRASMHAGLRERESGSGDTNTQHIEAEYILHKLVHCYEMEISSRESEDGEQLGPQSEEYAQVLGEWPPLEELAALLVMVGHAKHFEPEMLPDSRYNCTPELLSGRDDAKIRIARILKFCPKLNKHVKNAEKEMKKVLKTRFKSLVVKAKPQSKRRSSRKVVPATSSEEDEEEEQTEAARKRKRTGGDDSGRDDGKKKSRGAVQQEPEGDIEEHDEEEAEVRPRIEKRKRGGVTRRPRGEREYGGSGSESREEPESEDGSEKQEAKKRRKEGPAAEGREMYSVVL